MKASELKSAADFLSNFASVRENAEGPTSRIAVQAAGGRVKLIASDGVNGCIYDLCDLQEDVRYIHVLQSRPFLQGVKVIPARSDVTLGLTKEGLTITTDKGGSLFLENRMPFEESRIVRPPRGAPQGYIKLAAAQTKQISKLFPAVTAAKEKLSQVWGSFSIVGETCYVTFVEPRIKTKYASLKVEAMAGSDELERVASASFFTALGDMGDCEMIFRDNIIATDANGRTLYTTSPNQESWPVMRVDGKQETCTVDRKDLITAIKGQMPNDEHGRVVLSWNKGSLEIRPFGREGTQTLPVETSGDATRGMNGHLLNEVLNAMTCKSVTLGVVAGAPAMILTGEGYEDWTLMVAPLSTVL